MFFFSFTTRRHTDNHGTYVFVCKYNQWHSLLEFFHCLYQRLKLFLFPLPNSLHMHVKLCRKIFCVVKDFEEFKIVVFFRYRSAWVKWSRYSETQIKLAHKENAERTKKNWQKMFFLFFSQKHSLISLFLRCSCQRIKGNIPIWSRLFASESIFFCSFCHFWFFPEYNRLTLLSFFLFFYYFACVLCLIVQDEEPYHKIYLYICIRLTCRLQYKIFCVSGLVFLSFFFWLCINFVKFLF